MCCVFQNAVSLASLGKALRKKTKIYILINSASLYSGRQFYLTLGQIQK